MNIKAFCQKNKIKVEKLMKFINKNLYYKATPESEIPKYLEEEILKGYRRGSLKDRQYIRPIEIKEWKKSQIEKDKIEIAVPLHSIIFYNGYILIENLSTNKIEIEDSKEIYQKFLKELDFLHKITITLIKSERTFSLHDFNFPFFSVIEILKIEDKFRFRNKDYPIDYTTLPSWDMNIFSETYNSSFKEKCRKELHTLSLTNKIGYIPEVFLNNDKKIIKTEPSLLFIVSKKEKDFIIWESLLDIKATYVFTCEKDKVNDIKQSIIDFIGSPVFKNKRKFLIKNKQLQIDLNFQKRILHKDDFDSWRKSLLRLLNYFF